MFQLRRVWVVPTVLAAIAIAACSRGEQAGVPLSYAPADSPFVIANLERGAADLAGLLEFLSGSVATEFSRLVGEARAQLSATAIEPEVRRSHLRMLNLVEDKLTVAGWERVGFRRNALFALYGIGLSPVLRIELADAVKARTYIDELFSALSIRGLEKLDLHGHDYWRIPLQADRDVPAVIVAIPEQHLVLAFDAGGNGPLIGDLLGLRRPERNVQDSGALIAEIQRSGVGDRLVGLVDTVRLVQVAIMTAEQDTWWARELTTRSVQFSPTCKSELAALATAAPRIVAGYSSLDRSEIAWQSVLELRPDLAQQFATIVAPVPGSGSERTQAVIDFGFGVHLDRLAQVVQARATEIRQSPYACSWLSELNRLAEDGDRLVAVLYAGSTWFTGARLVVTDIAWEGKWPETLEAALVVATPNPRALVGMLHGIVPTLSDLHLDPQAPPVRIDPAAFGIERLTGAPTLHVALREGVIGIATGEQARHSLIDYMSAPAGEPPPLFHHGVKPSLALEHLAKLSMRMLGEELELPAPAAMVAGAGDRLEQPAAQATMISESWIRSSELELLGHLVVAAASTGEFGVEYTWDASLITERGFESRQSIRLR